MSPGDLMQLANHRNLLPAGCRRHHGGKFLLRLAQRWLECRRVAPRRRPDGQVAGRTARGQVGAARCCHLSRPRGGRQSLSGARERPRRFRSSPSEGALRAAVRHSRQAQHKAQHNAAHTKRPPGSTQRPHSKASRAPARPPFVSAEFGRALWQAQSRAHCKGDIAGVALVEFSAKSTKTLNSVWPGEPEPGERAQRLVKLTSAAQSRRPEVVMAAT